MHHVVLQLCFAFSLIELLTAGSVNVKRLVEQNSTFSRSDNGEANSIRRRYQPPIERKSQMELYPVIIGVKDGSDGVLENIFSRLSSLVRPKFKRINALSALLSREELDELKQDANVLYIEDDPMVYPDSGEASLYGLQMVQALAPIVSKQNITVTAACNNPSSFKIGIIDSGLAV
jgi:hypothetical protein